MENFKQVAVCQIWGEIPGEVVLTSWHSVRVYRSDIGPTRSYSVHHDITHFVINDGKSTYHKQEAVEYRFDDGSEADAKFQHLCLQAYSTTMSQRNRSY